MEWVNHDKTTHDFNPFGHFHALLSFSVEQLFKGVTIHKLCDDVGLSEIRADSQNGH